MNRLLAVICTAMLGLGVALGVASHFAAQAQGGWQPEAEDPEKFEMPVEWLAFGGVSFVLLAPLLYVAARSPDPAGRRL